MQIALERFLHQRRQSIKPLRMSVWPVASHRSSRHRGNGTPRGSRPDGPARGAAGNRSPYRDRDVKPQPFSLRSPEGGLSIFRFSRVAGAMSFRTTLSTSQSGTPTGRNLFGHRHRRRN